MTDVNEPHTDINGRYDYASSYQWRAERTNRRHLWTYTTEVFSASAEEVNLARKLAAEIPNKFNWTSLKGSGKFIEWADHDIGKVSASPSVIESVIEQTPEGYVAPPGKKLYVITVSSNADPEHFCRLLKILPEKMQVPNVEKGSHRPVLQQVGFGVY